MDCAIVVLMLLCSLKRTPCDSVRDPSSGNVKANLARINVLKKAVLRCISRIESALPTQPHVSSTVFSAHETRYCSHNE